MNKGYSVFYVFLTKLSNGCCFFVSKDLSRVILSVSIKNDCCDLFVFERGYKLVKTYKEITFLSCFKFFLPFVLLSSISFAKAKSLFNTYKDKREQSIKVVRLSDQKILYQENPDKSLVPASISKLFSAATFLVNFGGHYKLETDFYHSGQAVSGVVKGDLILVGRGDPRIVNEDLWNLVLDLKHLGFKSFSGDLVIDNSFFKDGKTNKRTKKATQNSYDAPLSAFGVNFNTYNIAVSPGKKIGQRAQVNFYPYHLEGVTILNTVKTVGSKSREKIQIRRVWKKGKEVIEASGSIRQTSHLKKFYRSSYNPTQLAGKTLKSFLKAHGIKVLGTVREGRLNGYKKTTKIMTHKSKPLSSLVKDFLLYSNNYMTDMLVNSMGAFYLKGRSNVTVDTYSYGIQKINSFLTENNLSRANFLYKSGSGLSLENKMSSSHVVSLLSFMTKKFGTFPEFLNALPKSGLDGTLKDRFNDSVSFPFKGQIRAKTGTLTQPVSVSSLAGYMFHKSHGLLAFSIIQNGIKGSSQPNILNLRKSQELGLIKVLKKL